MSLTFRHPRTRVWMTVRSHYPLDLEKALETLKKDHEAKLARDYAMGK